MNIRILILTYLTIFSVTHGNAQSGDLSSDPPIIMLENCFNAKCKNIYSQKKIQKVMGEYLSFTFHPTYYFSANKAKLKLKGAIILLNNFQSCTEEDCPNDLLPWSEENLSEAKDYLSCLHLIPSKKFDELVKKNWTYYSTGSGDAKWSASDEQDINLLYKTHNKKFLPSYDFKQWRMPGAYAFVDKNDFPACSHLKVSEKTLSNLRLIQPNYIKNTF